MAAAVVSPRISPQEPTPRLVVRNDAGFHVSLGDDLEQRVGGFGGQRQVAQFVDLCRRRHKSTYADLVVMPRLREPMVVNALSGNGFFWRWSA